MAPATLAPPTQISTRTILRAQGLTDAGISRLVKSGGLERIRNGWFARPGTDDRLVHAIRIGGRVTSSTALAMAGIWTMPDPVLHVAVATNASRLRCPDDRRRAWDPDNHPDIRLHWSAYPWTDHAKDGSVSIATALADLIRSAPFPDAMVAVDSALNIRADGRPLLTLTDLDRILNALPAKYARVRRAADGRSQSGLETLARLWVKRLNVRVRIQVSIRRVGRVDVLIGERFVLELDSRAHHLGDNYETDRTRDLELIAQGFLVLRVSYRRVMYDWASIERVILAVVRRGDHMRSGRHVRLDLARTLD